MTGFRLAGCPRASPCKPGLGVEDPGLEERLDQRHDAPVRDPLAHPIQQRAVGDLVEACRDVALQHPLVSVGCAGERADLSDRVVGTPLGPEAVGARQEVRLPDRLQHQFQRRLHDPIPHGCDAQPTQSCRPLSESSARGPAGDGTSASSPRGGCRPGTPALRNAARRRRRWLRPPQPTGHPGCPAPGATQRAGTRGHGQG